jgi:alkylation response protein AidB-like acyl-CoA dehydrogenase
VVLARTSDAPGSRSHSQVLVDKAFAPGDALVDLGRWPSVGMRGVQLGGLEFRDCPLPDGARITYMTGDPDLVVALHDWGVAQVTDHGDHAEHIDHE